MDSIDKLQQEVSFMPSRKVALTIKRRNARHVYIYSTYTLCQYTILGERNLNNSVLFKLCLTLSIQLCDFILCLMQIKSAGAFLI